MGIVGLKEALPRAVAAIEAKKRLAASADVVEDSEKLQKDTKSKASLRCEAARKLLAERHNARQEKRRMSLKGTGIEEFEPWLQASRGSREKAVARSSMGSLHRGAWSWERWEYGSPRVPRRAKYEQVGDW